MQPNNLEAEFHLNRNELVKIIEGTSMVLSEISSNSTALKVLKSETTSTVIDCHLKLFHYVIVNRMILRYWISRNRIIIHLRFNQMNPEMILL